MSKKQTRNVNRNKGNKLNANKPSPLYNKLDILISTIKQRIRTYLAQIHKGPFIIVFIFALYAVLIGGIVLLNIGGWLRPNVYEEASGLNSIIVNTLVILATLTAVLVRGANVLHVQYFKERQSFHAILLSCCVALIIFSFLVQVPSSDLHVSQHRQLQISTPSVAPSTFLTTCPLIGTAYTTTINIQTANKHSNIIYIHQEMQGNKLDSQLLRHDAITDMNNKIVELSNASISFAQVSSDGKWILFVAEFNDQSRLEMIGIDGQHLQNLYCAPSFKPISAALLSPDQQWVIFSQGANSEGEIYLLNMSNKTVQPELLLDNFFMVNLITWLNKTQVSIGAYKAQSSGAALSLYILDITRGTNQHIYRLKSNIDIYYYMSASYTLDSKFLFVSTTSVSLSGGPSSISVQPASGGKATPIFLSSTLVITTIRAISNKTLLFFVKDVTDASQNGLWKINMDGSGLKRLTIDNTTDMHGGQRFNQFAQDTWANVSRDGTMYALQVKNPDNSSALLFGSLNNNMPKTFTSDFNGALEIVGWALM